MPKNSKQHRMNGEEMLSQFRQEAQLLLSKADHIPFIYRAESCNILSKQYRCTLMSTTMTPLTHMHNKQQTCK